MAVTIILPSIALATWWNPFTWNFQNIFSWFNKPVKTEIINVDTNKNDKVATTTIKIETNFVAIGNLVKNNPRLKPDV
jgi:hypothetical protein